MKLNILYVLFFFFPSLCLANQLMLWKCASIDAEGLVWSDTAHYPKSALNKAKALCKKNSSTPWQCYTSRELCQVFSTGSSPVNFWRCTAFDMTGATWKSGPYGNRIKAGLGAMNFCEKFSTKPQTCYMHMNICEQTKR